MNKLSKPSKRLQLIEASKKRLVFELPPDPIPGCGYALAIYAVIALAITIAILLFRRREPSDLFWIPIVGLIWGVLFCSTLEWMWLVRERKLVVVEPFRIVLEILSGGSRSSEEIELGSTAWAELIRYRESDDGVPSFSATTIALLRVSMTILSKHKSELLRMQANSTDRRTGPRSTL